MKASQVLKSGVLPGGLAGLAGGLVLAAAMYELGRLDIFGQLAGVISQLAGFILVLAVSALLGAGFGVLVWYQRPNAGETLVWGLVYGVFWWYLGRLTILPLFQGKGLTWDVDSARAAFPDLLGLILLGGIIGLAHEFLRRMFQVQAEAQRVGRASLFRGALAGLLSAYLLGVAANGQDQLLAFAGMAAGSSASAAWPVILLIGLLAGVGFAWLFTDSTGGAGVGLIRGIAYGFFWWVAGGLTLVPLITGSGLVWTATEVQIIFPTLPGYLLFGAAVALLYQWLGALVRLLFSEFLPGSSEEGLGTQGLRIVGRSGLAALVGGLLFSLVMWQTGFLPRVADLIGSSSPVTGFIVHLAIAGLIGLSYGILFRRQSYDLGSALGWGVSYGFFWAMLGPLTLMPVLLGGTPQWTADAAASVFPNLIGHLGYGAGLGVTFYLLEARYSPWWVPRTEVQAARLERRKEEVQTSGPALWTLLILLGLTLPVLLAKGQGLTPIY